MKKRLVIAGLPCPPGAWEELLGPAPGQRIITMHEILAHTSGADPREMARYVTEQLEAEKPDSIVCHGMGVPLCLTALLRLKRRGISWDTRLTVFNGASRNVSLWRAKQPLRMQWTSTRRIIREVEAYGGAVDGRLRPFIPRIRAMYRMLILYRLADKMAARLGWDAMGRFPKGGLRLPVQIIASKNDPYLPFEAMEQLRHDLEPERFVEMDYGHFPYSLPGDQVRPLIQGFESPH